MTENTIHFILKSGMKDISDFRRDYLQTLPENQEYYLEYLIGMSEAFVILVDEIEAGYFLASTPDESGGRTLLEFYLNSTRIPLAEKILARIIQEYRVSSCLCKSFDHLTLSACSSLQKSMSPVGILCRGFSSTAFPLDTSLVTVDPAEPDQAELIFSWNDDFFDDLAEVQRMIAGEQLFLFKESKGILGIGTILPIIEGTDQVDVGMLVRSEYRGRGWGAYIIRYLTEVCLKRGESPSCGCGIDNIGSRRSLEKAGFESRYRMLHFQF